MTEAGCEDGSAFSLVTDYTSGVTGAPPTSIDPPGDFSPDSDVTTFVWDAASGYTLLESRTDPLVGTTSYAYDVFSRRVATTDPNGLTVETQYDELDRVVRSIHRAGALGVDFDLGDPANGADLETVYEYDVFGQLERVTLPEGNVLEYSYDDAGRLESVARGPSATQPEERQLYEYDDYGHRVTERLQEWDGVNPAVDRSVTEYEYLSRCHLDAIIHPDGNRTEYGYDCNGNLEKVWDANHHDQGSFPDPDLVYTYDELDRMTSVTQQWGGGGATGDPVTSYEYDEQDHLEAVVDASGNRTEYEYSDRDLLIEEISQAGDTSLEHVKLMSYNEHGELVSTLDARGVQVDYEVDAADRLQEIQYPASALDIVYSYGTDAMAFEKGRLVGITRHGATVTYAYDQFGRLVQDGDLGFAYDENGNRIEITYPGGGMATTGYDYADRPHTLGFDDGTTMTAVVMDATYLPSGPLSSLDFGNGLTETRPHTNRYFPDEIELGPTAGGSPLLHWSYTTDAVGNPTGIEDLVSADPLDDRDYGYQDYQYYLTSASGPWLDDFTWTYDGIGNRETELRSTLGPPADDYVYEANDGSGNSPRLDEILLAGGPTSRDYSFDAIGDQIQLAAGANVLDYTYDDAGRLAKIQRSSDDVAEFLYDGRSFLSHASSRLADELFSDDLEGGNLACWSSVEGGTQTGVCRNALRPIYDSGGLVHGWQLPADRAVEWRYVLYFGGRPVAQVDLGATAPLSYLTTDHLGTPVAMSDSGGSLLWEGGFEPFGGDWNGASAADLWLRFPGQWEDESWSQASQGNEILSNVNRWYQAATATYTRPDPLGVQAGRTRTGLASLFSYAGANPLRFIDRLGLEVTFGNDTLEDYYERLKSCYPDFREPARHFETDRWFFGLLDVTYEVVEHPASGPGHRCNFGGAPSLRNSVLVDLAFYESQENTCEEVLKCMAHEFYERWLIDARGVSQIGASGPANDEAEVFEAALPRQCCECS